MTGISCPTLRPGRKLFSVALALLISPCVWGQSRDGTQAEASPRSGKQAPHFDFTDPDEHRRSSTTKAERELKAHKEMLKPASDCPMPFDSPRLPTTEPRESQQPRCRSWRKAGNGR